MEYWNLNLCRSPYRLRLHQRNKILLPKCILPRSHRPNSQTQIAWSKRSRKSHRHITPRNPLHQPTKIALWRVSNNADFPCPENPPDWSRSVNWTRGCDFGDDAVSDSEICSCEYAAVYEHVEEKVGGYSIGDLWECCDCKYGVDDFWCHFVDEREGCCFDSHRWFRWYWISFAF